MRRLAYFIADHEAVRAVVLGTAAMVFVIIPAITLAAERTAQWL